MTNNFDTKMFSTWREAYDHAYNLRKICDNKHLVKKSFNDRWVVMCAWWLDR